MLKRLRLRLTLICVAMTTAVFAALMAVMVSVTEAQYRSVNDMIFRNNVDAVVRKLQTDNEIANTWLADVEITQASVVAIENNGQALYFPGVWSPPAGREALIAKAREYAREEQKLDYRVPPLDLTGPARAEFLLDDGMGNQYRCAVALIPAGENWFSLTMLCDMQAENLYVRGRRLLYSGLSLAVFAVLVLLSWWFTGQAIRPIGESMEKQRAFIAAASHELRSPLAVIRTCLAAMGAEPAETEKLAARADGVCNRMARLVDDLLLLANADAKNWRLQMAEVNPDVLLIETVEQFWSAAGEKGFALTLDLPEEILPPIRGDAERLTQVFSILIDNAIGHAGKGGEITIRARVGRQLLVEVIDHGAGIPAELREKVFDRFFQADKSRTEKRHFGLGLSIARELVTLHGGTIGLTETPGGGCTFQIALPLKGQ